MGRPASMSEGEAKRPGRADLLSVREAAAALGVHEHTLRSWVRKGIIHAIHLPGSHYCRFRPGEVHRLQLLMEGRKDEAAVRIERPRMGSDDLELAHKLHDEVMVILSNRPPEETLEEVMTRLRGRPWSS